VGRGQEISPGEGRSAPALPAKRRGRPKKVGICPADDKCAGCIRKTGCKRVKHAESATSAPAESPKPRERHAPERYEDAFSSEIRDQRESDNEAVRKKLKPAPVKESPIVAWLTGAAVKQAIAKAARSLAEGKSEDVIAQVGSLVEENALLKSDNAVLRNEIASLAKRHDKVRAELDAIKRAVARGLNKEDFEFSSHRSIIDEIVGKGYGHTDSGERLFVHARVGSGRPAEDSPQDIIGPVGSLFDESALLKSDSASHNLNTFLRPVTPVRRPATRQVVERSACRARHGQEGCDKGV